MVPEVIAITIVILLFSVIAHEVAHGYVALLFGDRTAENAGRLTLNPIPHIDPIGTILMPLLILSAGSLGLGSLPLFAWAKPVPVNPLNFSDIRKGELLVSLAGILTNCALAIIFAIGFHINQALGSNIIVSQVLMLGVQLNLVLAVFNLLPIPPLDGSHVMSTLLPYQLARQYQQLERYGFLILIIVLFFPPTRMIVFAILGGVVSLFMQLLGLRF